MARDEFANLPAKERLLARMIGQEVGAVLIGAQRADDRARFEATGTCPVCTGIGQHHPACTLAVPVPS